MDFVAPDLDFVAAGLDFGVSGLETHGCIVVRASPTGNAREEVGIVAGGPRLRHNVNARRQRDNRRGEERDDRSPFYFGASR